LNKLTKNEKFLIEVFETLVPNGYNISPTGGLNVPNCHSKETKEKIRQSRLGKKGKNANRWCGGNGITKDGYKYIYKPEHPNSMVAGYILEHRFIMSEHIGRPLDKNEIVHHKNQNKQDNRIKNLKIINITPTAVNVASSVLY